MDPLYRILCLSGGGLRGIFQSELLANLQKTHGPFWESFDLIVGTSTGSLIAAAIHQGLDPARVSDLYRKVGPVVFPQRLCWNLEQSKNALRAAINRKTSGAVYRHTTERFRKFLDRVYGESTTLADFHGPRELAVTSTDIANGRIRVFSPLTWEHDLQHRMVDILLASSSAPGMFPCCEVEDFVLDNDGLVRKEIRHYVDGGIWAHSPLLPAITLAHAKRQIPFSQMRVLSIGTGYKFSGFDVNQYDRYRMDDSNFRLDLLFTAMSTSNDAGDLTAACLLGRDNFLHVEPDLDPAQKIHLLDFKSAYQILPEKAKQVAESGVVDQFLNGCGSLSLV